MPAASFDQVVSLCKRRGFIYPGSAVYGGLANSWDFGPLGVELARNVKQQWWDAMVYRRDDVEGLDSGILLNRKVWKYSGHEGGFNDPLVDNKESKKRYRLDHLLEAQFDEVITSLLEAYKLTRSDNREDNIVGLVERMMADPTNVPRALDRANVIDPETHEPGDWTEPRQFNLMFSTQFGATADDENIVYLRPETAQGIFVNFKHVLETMRRKLPFGIAQIGKSFRNEITPGNFIFRTREFEQMEMEFFVPPPPYATGEKTDDDWHAYWVDQRYSWYTDLGLSEERLTKRAQTPEELAHYAKATSDIEYRFPGSLGFAELEGIANRTDFDLTAHSKEVPNDATARERLKLDANPDAVENLTVFNQDKKEHLVPYVIEPAAGVARPLLAFLCEAFAIEAVKDLAEADEKKASDQLTAYLRSVEKSDNLDDEDRDAILEYGKQLTSVAIKDALPQVAGLLELRGATRIELSKKLKGLVDKLVEANYRTVLKLDWRLAPIKIAVFPLKRNHPEIVTLAKKVRHTLSSHWRSVYDDTGAIGKLYRRQDEIGTPYCITVDFDSLDDNTVTVRNRDTMEQERVAIHELVALFSRHFYHANYTEE